MVERSPATALVDGDNGMGHLVMTYAANLAVEIARATGLAWVGARRSNHAGAGATYAAIPLAHGMVGIYGAVSGVELHGAVGRRRAVARHQSDRGRHPGRRTKRRSMLDIATSVASNGAIRTYALEGRPMPEGWVISREDGEPITDRAPTGGGNLRSHRRLQGQRARAGARPAGGPLNGAAFGRDIKDSQRRQAASSIPGSS